MYSRMRPRSRSPGGLESLRHGRRPQVHGLVVARNRFVGKLRGDACPARAATAGTFECCDVVDATVPVALVTPQPLRPSRRPDAMAGGYIASNEASEWLSRRNWANGGVGAANLHTRHLASSTRSARAWRPVRPRTYPRLVHS